MRTNRKTFDEIRNKLPDLASAEDLVSLGIFPSISTLNRLRIKGIGPSYIRFSDRLVRYPKESVIEYLEDRMRVVNVSA